MMMGTIDWESAMVIGAVAVFLVGMAAVLGGIMDRSGTMRMAPHGQVAVVDHDQHPSRRREFRIRCPMVRR